MIHQFTITPRTLPLWIVDVREVEASTHMRRLEVLYHPPTAGLGNPLPAPLVYTSPSFFTDYGLGGHLRDWIDRQERLAR